MGFSNSALIIGKTFEYNYEYESYFKNAALIVVLDSTIHQFLKVLVPFAPHVLLGDFDNPLDQEVIKKVFPDIQIVHTPDQDKTDFHKAIEYVLQRGYKNIIGLGLTGMRMDHTVNNIATLAQFNDNAQIKLIDDYSKIECISRVYNRYHTGGTQISLMPLGEVGGVITQNLKYGLMNESLKLGGRMGCSNEVLADGAVVITIGSGKLVVMECWD